MDNYIKGLAPQIRVAAMARVEKALQGAKNLQQCKAAASRDGALEEWALSALGFASTSEVLYAGHSRKGILTLVKTTREGEISVSLGRGEILHRIGIEESRRAEARAEANRKAEEAKKVAEARANARRTTLTLIVGALVEQESRDSLLNGEEWAMAQEQVLGMVQAEAERIASEKRNCYGPSQEYKLAKSGLDF